jgi:hypothetical protein
MAVDLDDTALVRWRASPIAFIEEMLHDPETGRPFVLLEAERAFMRHAFTLDRNGRLAYPELVCWEFDMRNGQSWFDPKRVKVRSYPVAVESGEELQKGPYVAEIFSVHVEDSYVIIET